MTTYTVTEVLSQNEWAPADDPTKKTIFFDFKAAGVEQVCSIGRKPGNELKVGDSFDADVVKEDRGKLKLKRVQTGGGWGGGGGGQGGKYEADPKKMRGEAMRSALHAAASYVVAAKAAGEDAKSDHVDALARRWYGLIVEAMESE